jgi:hypothetical protein
VRQRLLVPTTRNSTSACLRIHNRQDILVYRQKNSSWASQQCL